MNPETLAKAFEPIYSYRMPVWWHTKIGILTLAGGGVLVLAMLAFLIWYRWWYQPPLTLEQWRERELRALRDMRGTPQVNYKSFFGAATFFLKQYLHRLYGWKVLDKTDDELLAFVSVQDEVPNVLLKQIEELLSYAQMVKFADQSALSEKADEAIICLKNVVKRLQLSTKK